MEQIAIIILYRVSFITEDSVEGNITNPLSLNLYTYVENNPLIYVDPSGESAKDASYSYNQDKYLYGLLSSSDPGVVAWANAQIKAGKFYSDSQGNTYSINQIESVAKEFKMNANQRRGFGDYVESLKRGLPNNKNFTFQELRRIAREYLED